ncbi:16S rRNA (guanine(527)-N(7))-methyltransferase RsmG [soil metagenome]
MAEIVYELPKEALTPPEGFVEAAREAGVEFDPGDVEKLGLYLAHLLHVNALFNLTAITEPAAAWTRHILDALTLLPWISELAAEIEDDRAADALADELEQDVGGAEGEGEGDDDDATSPAPRPVGKPAKKSKRPRVCRVIDVGSGGGVPGIPLAIVMPNVRFTLLEPTAKKAAFLRRSAAALGLQNVDVVSDRAERAAHRKPLRERFDAATARAVGHLAETAELCAGFVRVGGIVLAIKGERAEAELVEAAGALRTVNLDHVETETTATGRIVALAKSDYLTRGYPRVDGEPKRRPLGMAAKVK